MSQRDTINSMTAGETILLAANNAALSVPCASNHFALMALVNVTKWVMEDICQPQHRDMVAATAHIGERAEYALDQHDDVYAYQVYHAVMTAAYDFSQTLDYNLSMEAPSLPF